MSQRSLLKNNQNYLFPALIKPEIILAVSRRSHKNMSLFYGNTADTLENRRDFLKNLDIDYHHLVCTAQIHGSIFKYVQKEDKGRGALSYADSITDTDALVTNEKNLPLAIFTADCLSIFCYDPQTPAIGLVHAGWRGTQEFIVAKTLRFMKESFNTSYRDLIIGFGPAIRSCCYEVNTGFKKIFPDDIIERERRYYLDLVGINKKQILSLEIKETNIFDSDICTSCRNKDFFSYRKEGNSCGRMMSVMMLR